jgi:hypothetical protein
MAAGIALRAESPPRRVNFGPMVIDELARVFAEGAVRAAVSNPEFQKAQGPRLATQTLFRSRAEHG